MMSRPSHLILALILGLCCLLLIFQTLVSPVGAVELIVLNTNDSGAGSLRQAIADAANGDTILFDSSLNGQTITLTSGELLITKTLTISGPGANLLAISGNNASRVLNITSSVTISGVMITEGFTSPSVGGGIYNNGTAVLINSTVFSNAASSGGGIYNSGYSSSGTLSLINSTVFRNTATSDGGGICNDLGAVNLTNTIISGNTSRDGGGITNSSGIVTLTNSTVSDNTAWANCGGIWDHFGTVNLTHSTISGNSGNGGAGICVQGTVTLTNSTVSGNTGGVGSGIWNEDGNLNLTSSTVLSNTPIFGIWNRFGTMTLTNTILGYNRVDDCLNDSDGTVISSGTTWYKPLVTASFLPPATSRIQIPYLGHSQITGAPP